ncbi:hypothetical protein BCV70DRAFT_197117 [Testicularia cyperi]|uniref:Uncharacterized protein n=1 Tax=Testicularia cyperi TaxID=1882483 RepID=A0A317XX47_9BASI|nr:hypothetical protein BCV70DRAFT_197117 [Testicularia cyperi]
MPNLDSLLSFPLDDAGPSRSASERTPIPPASSHIVVTDTIDAPAFFVLVHFLRASHAANKSARQVDIKGKSRAKDVKVVWIGCSGDGVVHLKHVARKSGIQIDSETQRGAFAYIDAASIALSTSVVQTGQEELIDVDNATRPHPILGQLYTQVERELVRETSEEASWSSETLVIIDDLSALSWSLDHTDVFGRPVDVARQICTWTKALNSLVTKHRASLVTLLHADASSIGKHEASDSVEESVLRSLLRTADVWIEVKELGSGRARDCDGEITVHPLVRPSLAHSLKTTPRDPSAASHFPPLQAFAVETPCPSRSKAVLYRIAPDGQSAATAGVGAGTSTSRVQVWARGTGRGFL